MLLVTTWFGTFLVDEGKVIEKRLFPREPSVLAERAKTVDDRQFVELIAAHGTREAMPLDATESVGAALGDPEKRSVMEMASLLRDLSVRRQEVEGYVEASAAKLAPNVTALAGP